MRAGSHEVSGLWCSSSERPRLLLGRVQHARGATRDGRPLEAKVLTQGRALVIFAEQTLRAKKRQNLLSEGRERVRQGRRDQVEAVGGAVLEPLDDRAGDLFGCA